MLKIISDYFKFNENNSSFKTETIAGITTFLTMAYIIVVNPSILSSTGMPTGAIFVATCLVAAFGSLLMGLLANYPVALAPSMGLNAYFAFIVVAKLGYSWQVALSAVFVSGILFALLTIFGIRQKIIYLMPESLKIGLTAGIGLFLGVIGLKNIDVISIEPHLQFHASALFTAAAGLGLLGLVTILILERLRVLGAIMIGILFITVLSILLGLNKFQGVIAMPPSIKPTLVQLHFLWPVHFGFLMVIFTFLFVALFDNIGTLIAVLRQAKLIAADGSIANLTPALFADSTATTAGSLLGTSTTGSYIESSSGVRAGGRTGFTAVVVSILFLGALFLAPLTRTIPAYATAPALLYVAILMLKTLSYIEWKNIPESLPALITTVSIPLTFSIANGIALGVISYVLLQIITRNFSRLNLTLYVLAVVMAIFLFVQ